MNELINYKGVYRTAPATPGLLIIEGDGIFCLKYNVLSLLVLTSKSSTLFALPNRVLTISNVW